MIDEKKLLSLLEEASNREKNPKDKWLYGTRNWRGHSYLHLALKYESCRPYFRALCEDLYGRLDSLSHAWDTGLTPIHIAAQQGYQECLKIMCQRSRLWTLQLLDLDGNTPLALAAAEGTYHTAEVILDYCIKALKNDKFHEGFDIAHTNSSGQTAMELADKNGHDKIVKLISDIRKYLGDDRSDIALMRSQRAELYKDMEKCARQRDHHHYGRCNSGSTSGRSGCSCRSSAREFRRLAQNITHNTCTPQDAESLQHILGTLLRGEQPPKSLYPMVMDVLDAASRCRFKDFLSHKDQDGRTALLLAAKYGHMALVRLLLTRGANIDDVDNNGCNVLHMVADRSPEWTLQFIIDMKYYCLFKQLGQFITHKDNNGKAPLHHAAQCGQLGGYTAEILLRPWSAGHVGKDNDGCTPLRYAVQYFINEDGDFDSYHIETIYEKSPVEEQLELFTDDGLQKKLINHFLIETTLTQRSQTQSNGLFLPQLG